MVGEMLENGLDGELDDELGYTKYDYRNKSGKNSRNGYSKKVLKTSFGEMEIKISRDREGEFEPQRDGWRLINRWEGCFDYSCVAVYGG